MHSIPWQPTATCEALRQRSELTWRIRSFFHARGLHEVHTPTLGRDTVVDRHIEPISLDSLALGLPDSELQQALKRRQLFLQTSPEFGMKRLLAAGMQAIYQIGPVYRAGESGSHHNPEFTMVEWYRVGDDMQKGVAFLSDLIEIALKSAAAEQRSYQEIFEFHVGIDPLQCKTQALAARAVELALGVELDWSNDRDDWLNLIFAEAIQPHLGRERPMIVTHYPASQSALARVASHDPRVAERFELFVGGIELANGYHELLDADELQRRNTVVNEQRVADGHRPLPCDSYLLGAMRTGFPACSGCALGLDRLAMVALGSHNIADVIAFPIERC